MRLDVAISVALLLSGACACAAEQGPEAFAESVVELHLNGQAQAYTVAVRHDSDGTLLVRATDLPKLRLRTPTQGAVLVNGERYYRIGVELGAVAQFDAATQSLDLTLPAANFVGTVTRAVDGNAAAPPSRSGVGGFLNYDVSAQAAGGVRATGAFLELGAFADQGVLTSGLLAQDEPARKGVVRLDTTWTRDLPAQLATLRVGDSISSTGAWGRAVRFGGLQFGTNFATQPTLVTTPLLAASGEAIVPSTVDVFINGQQVASQAVAPGPFTLENVPAITGGGQMQVVVTDALGRQQVVAQPYYSGPSLLRAGLQEYSAEIGAARHDYGQASNGYGRLVTAGTYRRGLTNAFTGEVHAEFESGGARAVGLDGALQLGHAGVLSATLAGGGDEAGSGVLVGIGFDHGGGRFNVFARSQLASESFAQLGTAEQEDRPRQRTFGGFGVDFGPYGGVQVACGVQSYWNAGTVRTVGLGYSLTMGPRGFLNFFASQSAGSDRAQTDLMLTWTMSLGARRTVSSAIEFGPALDGGNALRASASLQQNLPPGSGSGYLVSASSSRDFQLGYTLQGSAGRVGVEYARRYDEDGWRVDGSGGLAITAAGIMPSRWIDQSFAVVEVADYPGMTVYLENQPVARTDDKGRVLLPNLRAYESNQVSIDPVQLPMDATLATASMTVTPSYRSGPLVRFPVQRSQAVTLRLQLPDGTRVPAGARVTAGEMTYPVALDGLVFISDTRGATRARAEWTGGRGCTFDLAARAAARDPVPDLGVVSCTPAEGVP